MKRTKFIFIFIALVGIGFYLGAQSVIPGQGLFFAEVDERGPANEPTRLDTLLPNLERKDENGRISIVGKTETEEGISLCHLMDEKVLSYSVTLEADGVSVDGDKVQFFVEGNCDGNEFLIFTTQVCQINAKLFNGKVKVDEFLSIEGRKIDANFIKQSFFLAKLSLKTQSEEFSANQEDRVDQWPDSFKGSFSCTSF